MIKELSVTTLPPLAGDTAVPLYHRLVRCFQSAIARQQWRPGDQLPPEKEIAGHLGVAIGTVRQALSRLVHEGILMRCQGKGTFVKPPSFDSSLFRFWCFDECEEGLRCPPESRILMIRKTVATPAARDNLGLKKAEDVIFISRLRLRNGKPIVAEEIWLPYRKFSSLLDMDEKKIGPLLYPVYESICGQYVACAEERLIARAALVRQAKALGLKVGVPLIIINRLARGFNGSPLEWRTSWGCSSLFQYRIQIR